MDDKINQNDNNQNQFSGDNSGLTPTPYNPQAIIETVNPAVEIIRQKLASIYAKEPDVKEEIKEVKESTPPRSKHQQFIYNLSLAGLSASQMQQAWHDYYAEISDDEKRQVWQEFYMNSHRPHNALASASKPETQHTTLPQTQPTPQHHPRIERTQSSPNQIKNKILAKINSNNQLQSSHHVRSLLFGLSMGFLSIVVFLFGFFNERFIAPFITPSRQVSATPIIIDPDSEASVGADPRIIIPKINVEVPVVYDAVSIEEKDVQKALERGVVHYNINSLPGELGNTVIVGHSSNNILNQGKYKFAFVLLNRLEPGDTFMLTKDSKRYVYKVFDKKVVSPDDISVLDNNPAKPAIATLITCDPPGTSINRLIIVAEQVSPDPNANTASSAPPASETPDILPSNAPSLWQRIKSWFS